MAICWVSIRQISSVSVVFLADERQSESGLHKLFFRQTPFLLLGCIRQQKGMIRNTF